MDIKLKEIKSEAPKRESVSYEGRMPAEPKQYTAEKKEVSDNIKEFDARPRKVVSYDYNTIALNRPRPVNLTADQMLTDPLYNTIGKFLGVDTHHEWGKYYDKVEDLVDWAQDRTGKKDVESIMDFLNGALNAAPSFGMHHKRIDQLHLYAKMSQ